MMYTTGPSTRCVYNATLDLYIRSTCITALGALKHGGGSDVVHEGNEWTLCTNTRLWAESMLLLVTHVVNWNFFTKRPYTIVHPPRPDRPSQARCRETTLMGAA
jgi:hypothetical protein